MMNISKLYSMQCNKLTEEEVSSEQYSLLIARTSIEPSLTEKEVSSGQYSLLIAGTFLEPPGV